MEKKKIGDGGPQLIFAVSDVLQKCYEYTGEQGARTGQHLRWWWGAHENQKIKISPNGAGALTHMCARTWDIHASLLFERLKELKAIPKISIFISIHGGNFSAFRKMMILWD